MATDSRERPIRLTPMQWVYFIACRKIAADILVAIERATTGKGKPHDQ